MKNFIHFKKILIIFFILIVTFIFFNKSNLLINHFYKFLSKKELIILPKDRNNPIILQEKLELLKFISKNIGKNITSIKSIFISSGCNFGNMFILLNKAIFFCSILGCKKIIFNKKYYWLIKKKLSIKKGKWL